MKIINLKRFYSVIGLAILLLFSPCKVRNFVQDYFGLPLTEVINKSKTTISNANCNVSELSESKSLISNTTNNSTSVLFLRRLAFFNKVDLKQEKTNHYYLKEPPAFLVVPLYILYKNLKVYL